MYSNRVYVLNDIYIYIYYDLFFIFNFRRIIFLALVRLKEFEVLEILNKEWATIKITKNIFEYYFTCYFECIFIYEKVIILISYH